MSKFVKFSIQNIHDSVCSAPVISEQIYTVSYSIMAIAFLVISFNGTNSRLFSNSKTKNRLKKLWK